MKRWYCTLLVLAAATLPSVGAAQVLTPSRPQLDTLPRPHRSLPLSVGTPTPFSGPRFRIEERFSFRPGTEPAYILKDSAARVLVMVPPGNASSSLSRLELDQIAGIEVVSGDSLVRVLGKGFENGLIIITLTPPATPVWRAVIR
jgi:hypothetical protein